MSQSYCKVVDERQYALVNIEFRLDVDPAIELSDVGLHQLGLRSSKAVSQNDVGIIT